MLFGERRIGIRLDPVGFFFRRRGRNFDIENVSRVALERVDSASAIGNYPEAMQDEPDTQVACGECPPKWWVLVPRSEIERSVECGFGQKATYAQDARRKRPFETRRRAGDPEIIAELLDFNG